MGRASRKTALETRTARAKLAVREKLPYWVTIGEGLALGYRKGTKVRSWVVRVDTGQSHPSGQRKYHVKTLDAVRPDDFEDADGSTILSYFQAQERVRAYAKGERASPAIGANPEGYTVADAMADYLEIHQARSSSWKRTETMAKKKILPQLGRTRAVDLSPDQVKKWFYALARTDDKDPDKQRARKATANRVLTVLKAALNHAWNDGKIESKSAWERVKPFRGVDVPKTRYLLEAECERLLNACDSDFRRLVKGALLTGCRYGELVRAKVGDYNADVGALVVPVSKVGKYRAVPLNVEGARRFSDWCAGRKDRELIFTREDEGAWGTAHQVRRIKIACDHAKIDPPISFHDLRHTYGSLLAMRAVPLNVIAEVLGHADTRITHRHYAHLQPNYVADTIRKSLPSFGEEPSGVVKHFVTTQLSGLL